MKRLILIANRLPVTVEVKKNGEIAYNASVGGLATGLQSLNTRYECVWIGFSGVSVDSREKIHMGTIDAALMREHNSFPVPLTHQDVRLYYNGFANKTIWPLFHYFPYYTSFDTETWDAYVSVNRKFLESLVKVYREGDIIWVHDYHLMLLPGMIRTSIPDAKTGFFLHIPFPSYEVFRLLPWRKEILAGLLGSDLIGFHTFGYLRHFLSSIQRIAGIENSMGTLKLEGRDIKCDIFPMGIDYRRYSGYMEDWRIVKEIAAFSKNLENRKMILSMDRLDFTKGIVERLDAFERFLEKYPEYHEKVQMVLVAVPSRTKVETYIALRRRINEQVGRINGKYNTLTWSPIQYLYQSLSFGTIVTLYHCADVCLVTPLRDGMNLVAKEYIASRVNADGMLVLSEMAGCAEELGEALVVNPNNREEVADAIAHALEMSAEEKRRRISSMQHRLKRNDVFKWTDSFIEKLDSLKKDEGAFTGKALAHGALDGMMKAFDAGLLRLIMLDYDGTLVPFSELPEFAVPDRELSLILGALAENDGNTVAIISGRNREFLDAHFGRLPITLVSEHGAWIRRPGEEWKTMASLDTEWKSDIRSLLELYCDRTPGTFIEEKDFALAWHYRRADAGLASMRAMELKGNLLNMIANRELGILEGNKVIEVKSLEVSKAKVASLLLSAGEFDFILAAGDDVTDEDLFAAVPEHGYSIKVGIGASRARYLVEGVLAMRRLLRRLTGIMEA
jgi:trehalose 6-phosphate synthase/phosphatase